MVIDLTYVGSFPLKNTKSNVLRATRDVLSIPVDYPNYVQLEDMGDQFLAPLSKSNIGIYQEGENYLIKDDLLIPSKPFTSNAIQTLLDISKQKQFSGKIKGIKASITGPFTLASRIKVNKQNNGHFGKTAITKINLVEDFAQIVCKIANDYQKMGVDYITIDEPILSVMVGKKLLIKNHSEQKIVEIINSTIKGSKCLTGLHVCGRLSRRLVEILLRTEINILDHEFRDIPENLSVFNRVDFEDSNKKISMGLSSSRSFGVESVEDMYSLLKSGIDEYGYKNIRMVKPDCGFRGLDPDGSIDGRAYRVAISKLRNLRIALDSINLDLR
jgi:5-methyltetrahydropteroyltriglutamate--homocysteine methyltransferase